MKRRKKHVWLIVYPFEYPALQAYLNDMAEKGWKLHRRGRRRERDAR